MKGIIKDKLTGETLPNTNIYESNESGNYVAGKSGTTSNLQGIYEFSPNSSHISASFTGYKTQTKPTNIEIVNFDMEKETTTLAEIEIIGSKIKKINAIWLIPIFAALIYFIVKHFKK